MALTDLQERVWRVVAERLAADGRAPTFEEIAWASGLHSAPAARQVVLALERKGYVRRMPRRQRATRLVRWPSLVEEAPPAGVRLPVVGTVAAGRPIEPVETHDEAEWLPTTLVGTRDAYVLRVRGSSMIGDGILDGDLVVVEPGVQAENGQTVVARLADGSVTLKRLYRERDHVRLQPANPQLEAMVVPDVEVVGRVVAVMRRLAR